MKHVYRYPLVWWSSSIQKLALSSSTPSKESSSDGHDTAAQREHGTKIMLDKLGEYLQKESIVP